MWTQQKLSNETYLQYAGKVRLGFVGRQRQVEALESHARMQKLRQMQEVVANRLAQLKRPFSGDVLQRLMPWADQYRHDAMRFKFLVLRGGSQTGKSTLAKSLGEQFNFGKPFIQTVQSAERPDLREFDQQQHGYIVFDNVNNQKFILENRATLQANNDIHTLGESKTGMYSYPVWLYRVPIVVTIDLSAEFDENEPWIAENCWHLFLSGPCYL